LVSLDEMLCSVDTRLLFSFPQLPAPRGAEGDEEQHFFLLIGSSATLSQMAKSAIWNHQAFQAASGDPEKERGQFQLLGALGSNFYRMVEEGGELSVMNDCVLQG
jgi:hypothetical protein